MRDWGEGKAVFPPDYCFPGTVAQLYQSCLDKPVLHAPCGYMYCSCLVYVVRRSLPGNTARMDPIPLPSDSRFPSISFIQTVFIRRQCWEKDPMGDKRTSKKRDPMLGREHHGWKSISGNETPCWEEEHQGWNLINKKRGNVEKRPSRLKEYQQERNQG